MCGCVLLYSVTLSVGEWILSSSLWQSDICTIERIVQREGEFNSLWIKVRLLWSWIVPHSPPTDYTVLGNWRCSKQALKRDFFFTDFYMSVILFIVTHWCQTSSCTVNCSIGKPTVNHIILMFPHQIFWTRHQTYWKKLQQCYGTIPVHLYVLKDVLFLCVGGWAFHYKCRAFEIC